MRELGYVDEKTIVIEERYADGILERVPKLAAELLRLKVDVIVTTGPTTTRPAKEATRLRFPLSWGSMVIPLARGSSPAWPTRPETLRDCQLFRQKSAESNCKLLKEIVPRLSRVAILGNSTTPDNTQLLKETRLAVAELGVRLQYIEVRDPKDIDTAFRETGKQRADAVLVLPNSATTAHRKEVAELALKGRLPAIYYTREFVEAGGLMSYGVSITDLFRRAAYCVDRILKGAKPADLPIEQPTKFELVINRASREADVFSGSQSRRGKSQSPVTWVAGWRETKTLKPTDGAIERMVRESPGRNGSERTGGPEILKPRRPSLTVERRRQHGPSHLADAAGHSGGVIATAR